MRRLSLLTVAVLLSATPSFGQGYSHTILIEGGPGTDFLTGIAFTATDLNNLGTVAFRGRRNSGQDGIFTTNVPGSYATHALDTQTGLIGFGAPRINDTGQLTYLQLLRDFPGIGVSRVVVAGTSVIEGGPAPGTASTFDNFNFNNGEPGINNSGSVVFGAKANSGSAGIWRVDGGVVSAVETSASLHDFGTGPTINNNGEIAYFRSTRDLGSEPADRIMRASNSNVLSTAVQVGDVLPGLGAITGFPGGGTFSGTSVRPDRVALNDAGTIAFIGQSGASSAVASVSATGTISTIVTTGQPAPGGGTFTNVFYPSINNHGDVIYVGTVGSGSALYFSSGGTIRRVVGVGDLLLGSTVVSVGSGDINDAGQIVFAYQLNDGRTGIAITGLTAPEPGTLSLIALAGFGAIALRRCPRK